MCLCFARLMCCVVSLLHLFWTFCDVGFTLGVMFSCCDVCMLGVDVDIMRCSLPFGLDILCCIFKLVFSFWGFVLMLIFYAERFAFLLLILCFENVFMFCKVNVLRCVAFTLVLNILRCRLYSWCYVFLLWCLYAWCWCRHYAL